MTWVPVLQRREARPVGALMFLFALIALPMGTCGAMGRLKLHATRSPSVQVDTPSALERMATGSYVEADLALSGKDPRTQEDRTIAGWRVYQVMGAPHVIVFSKASLAEHAHVSGQLCDEYSPFTCEMPDPAFGWYLRNGTTDPKVPMRALIGGAAPADSSWVAWTELGVAAACAVAFLFAAASMVRAARRPGRVVSSRTLTLPRAPQDIRAALRAEEDAQHRLAEDSPSRICVLLGKPAGAARMTGMDSPEMVPLRVDVELSDGNVYRGTTATITVRELIPTPMIFQSVAIERASDWALRIVNA